MLCGLFGSDCMADDRDKVSDQYPITAVTQHDLQAEPAQYQKNPKGKNPMSPKTRGKEIHKAGAQRQEKNCAPVNPVNPPLLFFSGHHPTMPAFWKCFLSRRWPNNVPRIARTAVMTIPKSMSAGEVTIESCIFKVFASKPLLAAIS